jgi:cell division transport system ATP-binding protein
MKVVFDDLTKTYGVISALKKVSFEVKSGEFVFIVGPSGSGKSTLLKLILNQVRPTSGRIILDELDLHSKNRPSIDKIRRQIGVIFQDYQLIPDKTVEENILLALDIVSYPQHLQKPRLDEVLKKVNLQSRRFLFPSQLSGGELQRAALARALAIKPRLILADEPTGNLDPLNSWNLIKLLRQINEEDKTTIIMTTHNLEIVDSLNFPIIQLKNGVLESIIPPKNSSPVIKVKKKKKLKSPITVTKLTTQ